MTEMTPNPAGTLWTMGHPIPVERLAVYPPDYQELADLDISGLFEKPVVAWQGDAVKEKDDRETGTPDG